MASVPLSELLMATQEEIVSLKNDLFFRMGDSTDARNAENPVKSISLTRQVNKAIYDIFIETRFNMTNETLAFAVNAREVAIPSDWLDVLTAHVANLPLRKTTIAELDRRNPRWRTVVSSTPRRYYLNGGSFVGLDVPFSANSNLYLTVVKNTTPLNLLADTVPSYPTSFSYLISTRAAWHCCKIDATNPAANTREKVLYENYISGITALKEFVSNRMTVDNDAPRQLSESSK